MPRPLILVIALLLLSSACAPAPRPAGSPVAAGAEAWVSERLYLGRAIPGGDTVTIAQWRAFLHDVVTPAFPDGLTAWYADGQWQAPDGTMVREETFVLEILHPARVDVEAAIGSVVEAYRRRFAQQSVLRATSPARVRFYADAPDTTPGLPVPR